MCLTARRGWDRSNDYLPVKGKDRLCSPRGIGLFAIFGMVVRAIVGRWAGLKKFESRALE